jgi:farnesyl-diphosphate farnesyltransferase
MFYEKALSIAWDLLPHVSRSFALTIPFIESPYKEEIMLGYLEARILDTFEDSPIPLDLKERAMRLWIEALSVQNNAFKDIVQHTLSYISDLSYKLLVEQADTVLFLHKRMSAFFRLAAEKWFSTMMEGMLEFQTRRVITMEDLDDYAYYVAGVVGHFLTDVIASREHFAYAQVEDDAREFGLFLQKVNIIRDVRHDILHGHYFWPQELLGNLSYNDLLFEDNVKIAKEALNTMIASAERHIPHVERYIDHIPDTVRGYKKFCAVNYLMARKTLDLMKDNTDVFYSQQPVKISREEVKALIKQAEGW